MPIIVAILVVLVVLVLAIQYWFVTLPIVAAIVLPFTLPKLIRRIRKDRFFKSQAFREHKAALAAVVSEHNEIAQYIEELRSNGSFALGASSTGQHAHLASFDNVSRHDHKRDRNVAQYKRTNVHNCSLQVVRNAAASPLKYLVKYFEISVSEESIRASERLGEFIARVENGAENLKRRRAAISRAMEPPQFILKYYSKEFMEATGVQLTPVAVPHPRYVFEYVSAGGNSAQRTTVTMDIPTIDALVEMLSEKLRFRRSAAGQRALMTSKLRDFIKTRDGHRCRSCSVSVAAEPNLLLEIDHIIPVSRGGLSVVENLQTLCWRCNRSKSNTMPAVS